MIRAKFFSMIENNNEGDDLKEIDSVKIAESQPEAPMTSKLSKPANVEPEQTTAPEKDAPSLSPPKQQESKESMKIS